MGFCLSVTGLRAPDEEAVSFAAKSAARNSYKLNLRGFMAEAHLSLMPISLGHASFKALKR